MTNSLFFKQDLRNLSFINSSPSGALVGKFIDAFGNYTTPLLTLYATGSTETSLLSLYTRAVTSATALPEGVFECQVVSGDIYLDWRAYRHGTINTSVVSSSTLVKRGTFLVLGNETYNNPRSLGAQTLGICSANTISSATGCTLTVEFFDATGKSVPLASGSVLYPTITILASGSGKTITNIINSYGYETTADIPGYPNLAVRGILRVEATSACALVYNRGGSPSGTGTNGFYDTLTAPVSAGVQRVTQGNTLSF
jgi:hypothetical protein